MVEGDRNAATSSVDGSEGGQASHARGKKAIDHPYLHRLQRRHFLLFDVLPLVGTVAAIAFLAVHPLGLTEVALFLAMWLLTGFGVTVGYHRYFTHRSFKASPAVAVVFTILGSMAGQGALLSWVAMHRRHHECSDQPGDPHSPNLSGSGLKGRLRGLVHSHFLWMRQHEYPSIVHYAPDLLRNRRVYRLARYYHYWVTLGLVLPAVVGGAVYQSWTGVISGFLWGGVVRMFVLEHTIWSINSLLHSFGSRAFESREYSRNGGLFALVTFGECWHNNHHAFPDSPWFGLAWYRLDPGYWLIRLLAVCGLAWDLRLPSAKRLQAKRRARGKDTKPITQQP